MINGFDAREAAEVLDKALEESRLRVMTEFLNRLYSEAYKKGREMEFKTAQDHEKGMGKLKRGEL